MPLRRNRFASVLAMLAMALQAFWPLLSHARPKVSSLLVPVCTIDGISHVIDLKTGKTPLDERTKLHGEHCKLCVFDSGRDAALLPLVVFSFPDPDSRNTKRIFYQASLSKPAIPSPAQPRAPPQSS